MSIQHHHSHTEMLFFFIFSPPISIGDLCGVLYCELIEVVTYVSGVEAISWISKAFSDDSALLKHELAYCLGQMQDRQAIPTLTAVLKDAQQEPMVRHEAGTWFT